MKKFIFLAVILLLGAVAFSQKQAIKPPFTKGVNFSLWFQVPNAESINSNFFTEQDFKNVKALGCDSIRLPIHFENLSSGAPNYIISEKAFLVLDKAVKWAGEQEIYLILDNHSWQPDGKTASDIEKRLLKYWPQIAERYKDSGKYVVYELLNEPHGIDNAKWGKIQQKVINEIRKIDTTHAIVVGGADFNSAASMLALPKFSDNNLIYTFHYYDPMEFTHQGAVWLEDFCALKGIPFPYSKERMPPKPKNLTSGQDWHYNAYKDTCNLKSMETVFEKVAVFSIKRNAPVWCGEFGVLMYYAPENDRVEWYKTIVEFMDSRNIARTSWDYYDSFGLFRNNSADIFPDDLNKEILKALKYNIPNNTPKQYTWFENARRTGIYTIYKNGFVKGLTISYWFEDNEKFCAFEKQDKQSNLYFIDLQKLNSYNYFSVNFKGGAKFSEEKNNGYVLEFEARTKQNGFKMQAYFMNSDKTGEEWRATAEITNAILPPDGEWHKIRIPLKDFVDNGAWNNLQKVWINSLGIFDWNDIQQIVFENQDKEITSGISFREIRITK